MGLLNKLLNFRVLVDGRGNNFNYLVYKFLPGTQNAEQ